MRSLGKTSRSAEAKKVVETETSRPEFSGVVGCDF
jgi:hypothetical protein